MGAKGSGGFGDEICEPSQIVRPENDYVLMILSRDEVAKRVDARGYGCSLFADDEGIVGFSLGCGEPPAWNAEAQG